MAYRKMISIDLAKRMNKNANSAIAMNSNSSKGFTNWVNKDLKYAEETGDWSLLVAKAQKATNNFRNTFYK
jgi:hypothetical protein